MNAWAQDWVQELAEPATKAGMSLCPFAKKAWDNGHVKVVNTDSLWDAVHEEVKNFGKYKVVMCAQRDSGNDYFELEAACAALNRWFCFSNLDLWLLASQKDRDIVFIQRLSELDEASLALEKLGYYKDYAKEDYDRLINQRRLLRKKETL